LGKATVNICPMNNGIFTIYILGAAGPFTFAA
jgi:hypothetical protein